MFLWWRYRSSWLTLFVCHSRRPASTDTVTHSALLSSAIQCASRLLHIWLIHPKLLLSSCLTFGSVAKRGRCSTALLLGEFATLGSFAVWPKAQSSTYPTKSVGVSVKVKSFLKQWKLGLLATNNVHYFHIHLYSSNLTYYCGVVDDRLPLHTAPHARLARCN